MPKIPAIFIDRDGTINEERGYINHIDRFVLIKGVPKAIKLINDLGYLAIVITNQSGVARGYYDIERMETYHEKMKKQLAEAGAHVDAVYFCPHHPQGTVKEFAIECTCRKPETGMIDRALEDFEIDLDNSFLIGDRYRDILFGKKLGLTTILVKTGYGKGEWEFEKETWNEPPDHIADDLLQAVQWIKERVL